MCIRDRFKRVSLRQLDVENIKDFLLYCKQHDAAAKSRNLYLNAIKFYYYNIICVKDKIAIRSAKQEKRIPVVLTREEIKTILSTVDNPKHKLMLSLAYGAGLRVSGVVNLKVEDIDFTSLTLHIKHTKGLSLIHI